MPDEPKDQPVSPDESQPTAATPEQPVVDEPPVSSSETEAAPNEDSGEPINVATPASTFEPIAPVETEQPSGTAASTPEEAAPTDDMSDTTTPTSDANVATFGSAADAPSAASEPISPAPMTTTPAPKKGRKGLLAIIAAVVVAVLIGGGVAAYNLWYQNPQKVITDSIVNLATYNSDIQSDFTASFKDNDVSLTATGSIKGNQDLANGTANLKLHFVNDSANVGDIEAKADFAATKDTAYFKVSGLQAIAAKAIDAYADSITKQYSQMGYQLSQQDIAAQKKAMLDAFTPLINKIDNHWFKADISNTSSNDATQCSAAAFNKLKTDRKEQAELQKAYNDHRFIVVKEKLGSKDGSLGYVVDINKDTAKAFGKAVDATAFGKQLAKCDGSSSVDSSVDNSDGSKLKSSHVEVWVNRWSHNLTELKASVESNDSDATKANIDVKLKYDKASGLTTPKDATDIKDLSNELNGLLGTSPTSDTGSSNVSFSI